MDTQKSRIKGYTIAMLGVALTGLIELTGTTTQGQKNAKRPTAEVQCVDLADDEHEAKLSAGEQEEHPICAYEGEPALSTKTDWFEAWGSGNPVFESVYTWLLVGIAIILLRFYFALLIAAFAGIVTWGLACAVLLLVYGIFSGFEYSDRALSVISIISAIFVGIPVFIRAVFGGIYTHFTGRHRD